MTANATPERTEWVSRAEWVADGVAMLEIWYGQNALMACYLVEGTRRALIDTGTTDSPTQAIAPALAKLGRRIEDIDLVLNTHGHVDHAWGNADLKRHAPNATISLHAADIFLRHQTSLLEFWHKRRLAAGDIDAAAMASHTQQLAELADAPAHFPIPDRTHAKGDIIDLGGGQTIHVVHTPGHTPGSCSFYVPRARALLGGDSLTGSADTGRFPLLSNVVTYRQTVLDVQRLDVEFVGPAHRYPFRPPAATVVTPARPGDLARTFLADTLTTALDIEAGTAEAWQANRHGPRRALVADALIRVGARLGIDLSDREHARAAVGLWLDVFGAPPHSPA